MNQNQKLKSYGSFPEGNIAVCDTKINKTLAFWKFTIYSLFNQYLSALSQTLLLSAKETMTKELFCGVSFPLILINSISYCILVFAR